MKFLDLHAHPVFKTLFNEKSPWEYITAADSLLGDILDSQCNLQQITHNGECNLLCIALHPPETAIIGQWLLKILPLLTDDFDPVLMRKMVSGNLDYQHVLAKELSNLHKPPAISRPGKPIVVLTDFKDYKPEDFSRLYVIFSIEGGHCFYNAGNATNDIPRMLEDFKNFVNRLDRLFLYITTAHLAPNIFMTHAYGSKLLAKGKLLPKDAGISSYGEQFLDEISKLKLLVDVKHMSLVTRQRFYEKFASNGKPLICSHAGITGISWHDKLNSTVLSPVIKRAKSFVKITYHKPPGHLGETRFNPCSINLYNEDIIRILGSDGMIGLSFDLRILGGDIDVFGNLKLREKEFLSPEEFHIWEGEHNDKHQFLKLNFDSPYKDSMLEGEVDDDVWDDQDRMDENEELNTLSKADIINLDSKLVPITAPNGRTQGFSVSGEIKVEHTRFLLNQIAHIVTIAQKAGLQQDPWKHICLGSDFDGFIRAIDSCKNVSLLDSLGSLLIRLLPSLENEANIKLPRPEKELIEDIFFHNAFQFIQRHFQQPA